MGLVAVILCGIGAYNVVLNAKFAEGAVRATGTVTGLSGQSGAVKGIITFLDKAGRQHKVVSSISSNPPAFKRGERVDVLYRPGDPDGAHIDSFLETWTVVLFTVGMGTLFAIGGVLAWVFRKRLFSD